MRLARLAAATLAVCLLAPPARAAVVEEIVAKVNNRVITASEYEERQKALVAQVAQEHPGVGMEEELKDAQDSLLANVITEALLIERAGNIFDMDRIRGSLVEDFRKQQNIGSDAELETALKDQGMTRKELEEQLIRLAVPTEIINYDVKRKISVSETEIKTWYDAHRATFETPETVTLREVVLLYSGSTRDETLARAQAIAAEARGGADFKALVAQHSEAGTRETEGVLGPVAVNDLQSDLAAAAHDLKEGAISDPVDTGRSFHVLRLESRVAAGMRSLDEAHDEVRNSVREEKFRPRFDNYLKRLWKENHIEVSPKYQSQLVVTPLTAKKAAG
ncbi:MAG TPA: peptidyl-prolyl cis-trans isomerase [Candidatus Polarisedimenticolia bacterium]|nr:peptidyl-prolyl cis-trans isomerase [Candidatus Polarisedimenticolia bacterium]